MAREIHDTLAQGFASILMQLEDAESALETARPKLAIERLSRATPHTKERWWRSVRLAGKTPPL